MTLHSNQTAGKAPIEIISASPRNATYMLNNMYPQSTTNQQIKPLQFGGAKQNIPESQMTSPRNRIGGFPDSTNFGDTMATRQSP